MATIADTIRASLAECKTNKQVLTGVKASHPTANTSAACVSYYRSKMKKAGTVTATATAKPKQSFEGMELDVTMHLHVSDLVNDALLPRDVARMAKGNVAFIKADGKLYTAKCKPTEKNIAAIKAKHVGCVVLNGMSDPAVRAAVRALA